MTKEIVLVLRKNTGGKHVCRTAADAPSGVSKVGHGIARAMCTLTGTQSCLAKKL